MAPALQAYRLPPTRVFTDVATRLANKDRYNEVRQIVQCIAKSNLASPSINDEVCLAAIKVLASQSSKKEVNALSKLQYCCYVLLLLG